MYLGPERLAGLERWLPYTVTITGRLYCTSLTGLVALYICVLRHPNFGDWHHDNQLYPELHVPVVPTKTQLRLCIQLKY